MDSTGVIKLEEGKLYTVVNGQLVGMRFVEGADTTVEPLDMIVKKAKKKYKDKLAIEYSVLQVD